MSDYNSNGSVPPLIPGDMTVSDAVFNASIKMADSNGKLGFFGVPVVPQQDTTQDQATVVLGGSSAVLIDTTFNGYTISQVVSAMQKYGLLAVLP